MNTLKMVVGMLVMVLVLAGCADKQDTYYDIVQKQNASYMEAYKTVENESVEFDGTFNGRIKMVKPKKLPQLATIRQAKSGSEVALDWVRTLAPVGLGVAGYHYNFRTADSANKYNAESIGQWTGNFENANTSTSVTNNTSTESVTDVSSSEIATTVDSSNNTSVVDTVTTP